MWNPFRPPDSGLVGIKNCKKFFSRVRRVSFFIIQSKKSAIPSWDDICWGSTLSFDRKCQHSWKKLFTVFDIDCSISHGSKMARYRHFTSKLSTYFSGAQISVKFIGVWDSLHESGMSKPQTPKFFSHIWVWWKYCNECENSREVICSKWVRVLAQPIFENKKWAWAIIRGYGIMPIRKWSWELFERWSDLGVCKTLWSTKEIASVARTAERNRRTENVFHMLLRLCETPPSPPAPDPVGIENCKQLFSPLLAFKTQKIATRSTDIISAERVAFFWVVNATRNEKSCLQFLIPTAVFHMLLR